MAITSQELADICGVSRGTVARALSDKGRIDPNTKAKILAKAKKLGYQPNPIARSLASGKSKSIGVIAFDIRNRYFAQLLNAIEIEAKKKGYFISFTLQENDPDLEKRMVKELTARRVDGILLCSVNKGEDYATFLKDLGIPVITIGNFISPKIPHIGMDDRKAASDMIERIINKGYTNIIFYCPSLREKDEKNIFVHEERLSGVMDILDSHPEVSCTVYSEEDISEFLLNMIKDGNKKPACFCSGDIFALEILKNLKMAGISVPGEIGLAGFDGIDTIEYVTPSLSTVHNPVEEIGRMSVNLLIDNLENNTSLNRKSLVDYVLLEGETI